MCIPPGWSLFLGCRAHFLHSAFRWSPDCLCDVCCPEAGATSCLGAGAGLNSFLSSTLAIATSSACLKMCSEEPVKQVYGVAVMHMVGKQWWCRAQQHNSKTCSTEDISGQKSSVCYRARGEPVPHATKAGPHRGMPTNSKASHKNSLLHWFPPPSTPIAVYWEWNLQGFEPHESSLGKVFLSAALVL